MKQRSKVDNKMCQLTPPHPTTPTPQPQLHTPPPPQQPAGPFFFLCSLPDKNYKIKNVEAFASEILFELYKIESWWREVVNGF